MRSRFAVTFMLVLGFLISGSGAALAVSGISASGSAAENQYPAEVVGQQGGEQGETGGGGNEANQGTQGTEEAAQVAQQVAVTGEDSGLAFTGFAAIPLLLVGVGLTTAGLILRRPGTQEIG